IAGFEGGRRLALLIKNEYANPLYTTGFLCSLFEEESKELFDVRQAILGHLQQGGDPSPFDRIQATRLAAKCIEFLIEQAEQTPPAASFIGIKAGQVKFFSLEDLPRML